MSDRSEFFTGKALAYAILRIAPVLLLALGIVALFLTPAIGDRDTRALPGADIGIPMIILAVAIRVGVKVIHDARP